MYYDLLSELFKFFLLLQSVVADCYNRDGTLSEFDNTPCSSSDNSTCCQPGWKCLYDNKLCNLDDPGGLGISYVRGGCTDKSWKSEACPAFCGSENDTVDKGSGVMMFPCNGDASDTFCCVPTGSSTCNCTTAAEVIRFNSNGPISALGECRLSKCFMPNFEDP